MKNKIYKIGNILVIISIVFIVKSILSLDTDLHKYFFDKRILIINSFLVLIITFVIFLNSYVYGIVLNTIIQRNISKIELNNIFLSSNLGKYLPGNIMHFVSRNIIGIRYGVNNINLIYATILEVILVIISCLSLALISGFNFWVRTVLWYVQNYRNYIIIGFWILTILILMFIYLLKKDIINSKKVNVSFSRKYYPLIFKAISINLITFSLTSMTFVILITTLLAKKINYEDALIIFSVYLISWLFGFITPGAPGGLGVRELILILFLGSIFTKEVLVAATIIHRFITILADVFAFILFKLFLLVFNKKVSKGYY
jgi:hypothetical protein